VPPRMTRRDILAEFAGAGGSAALAALALALAGCGGKSQEQPKRNSPDSNAASSAAKDMRKYVCGKCGYVHDPAASDPARPFADLPADWKCPKCGSPKSRFAPKS